MTEALIDWPGVVTIIMSGGAVYAVWIIVSLKIKQRNDKSRKFSLASGGMNAVDKNRYLFGCAMLFLSLFCLVANRYLWH